MRLLPLNVEHLSSCVSALCRYDCQGWQAREGGKLRTVGERGKLRILGRGSSSGFRTGGQAQDCGGEGIDQDCGEQASSWSQDCQCLSFRLHVDEECRPLGGMKLYP